mgnify:FL=1
MSDGAEDTVCSGKTNISVQNSTVYSAINMIVWLIDGKLVGHYFSMLTKRPN